MIVVGLVGRIGAGKSTVARDVRPTGGPTVIDADGSPTRCSTSPPSTARSRRAFGAERARRRRPRATGGGSRRRVRRRRAARGGSRGARGASCIRGSGSGSRRRSPTAAAAEETVGGGVVVSRRAAARAGRLGRPLRPDRGRGLRGRGRGGSGWPPAAGQSRRLRPGTRPGTGGYRRPAGGAENVRPWMPRAIWHILGFRSIGSGATCGGDESVPPRHPPGRPPAWGSLFRWPVVSSSRVLRLRAAVRGPGTRSSIVRISLLPASPISIRPNLTSAAFAAPSLSGAP